MSIRSIHFSHTSLDGRSPYDRMKDAGYTYAYAAENIAAGNSTVAATLAQWLNSAGHCANIMNSKAIELGVGYAYNSNATYKHYWVLELARPL